MAFQYLFYNNGSQNISGAIKTVYQSPGQKTLLRKEKKIRQGKKWKSREIFQSFQDFFKEDFS